MMPEFDCYVEPFLGSGSVLVGLPKKELEYVNDINSDIINFYDHVKYKPEQLYERIQENIKYLKQFGKDYFYSYRDLNPTDPFDRAVWIYVINKSCMNGILRFNKAGLCNSSYCGTAEARGWMTKEWLEDVHLRIYNTQFTSLDVQQFLKASPNYSSTFIFLDPPYFERDKDNPDGCLTRYNGKKFTIQDQSDLADYLDNTNCKWMLTINDCKWIRDRYSKYSIHTNVVPYSCSQTAAGRGPKQELIITNYENLSV